MTDEKNPEDNGRRPPGPYEPQTPEEFDQDRVWYTGGMVAEYGRAVAEAEQGVSDALDLRDVDAFLHFSKELSRARTGLEHHEHEHMRATLGRLEGDEDTPPEVLA